jgi:hypothetical protein
MNHLAMKVFPAADRMSTKTPGNLLSGFTNALFSFGKRRDT